MSRPPATLEESGRPPVTLEEPGRLSISLEEPSPLPIILEEPSVLSVSLRTPPPPAPEPLFAGPPSPVPNRISTIPSESRQGFHSLAASPYTLSTEERKSVSTSHRTPTSAIADQSRRFYSRCYSSEYSYAHS